MSNGKHRIYTGALVVLFLLAGLFSSGLVSGGDARVAAESTAAPDLMVDTITLAPELPTIGYPVTITVSIRNQGDSPAGNSRLACFIDDNLFSSALIDGINPGGTVIKTVTWKAQAGPHIIKAVIDNDNSVAEIDENNNEKTFAFCVHAPDLVVESISWVPKSPSTGDIVTITVTIKNQGSQMATGSSLGFNIDGDSRGAREIPSLEVGANSTTSFTWLAISGSHIFEAFADRLNQVKESNETNNNKVVTYTTAAPDLLIDSITWSPQNRSESTKVTMSVKISNQGSGKANGFWIAYYVDESQQATDFVEEIKAGGSVTKKYSWIAGAGSHTLKALADCRDELIENDETNNSLSVILSAILPDLVIQSITRSSEKSYLSDGVIIIVIVKNQGLNLSGFCDLTLHINGTYELHQEVPILPSGGIIKRFFNCFPRDESITLKAAVDANNVIQETNEANNTRTVKIGPPSTSPNTDLTIESITWTPAAPTIGDNVTITTSIKNKGPGQASYSHVDYYIDDTFLDSVYAKEIDAGKTIVNTVTWQAAPGTHIVKVIADCNNDVAETNETNNEKTAKISVSAPDLVVQGFAWSPVNPKAGDEVSLTVTVKNQGDRTADSTYINYYVDDYPRGEHCIGGILPGGIFTRTFTWRLQNDFSVFKVVIDEAGDIRESNEDNNEKTIVLPAPDLMVESIIWSPEILSENATVTFNIGVKNLGAGVANSPQVTVSVNGTFLASVQFNKIKPGETVAGACTWTAQNGENVVTATVDGADTITENDETNNEKTVTLAVKQEIIEEYDKEIESTVTPDSILPETVTANDTDIVKALLFEEVSDNRDIAADIGDTSVADKPWWQRLLTNRLFIIGAGVLGVGALLVLMLFRKKSREE